MVRIGISGSFGGMNLGDEAILQSMVAQLRAAIPDIHITVSSLNPSDTMLRHAVDHAIRTPGLSREELLEEVRKFDLLLLGGGGILFDFWVKEHLREALLAEEAGVTVMVYAVGAGPIEEPASIDGVRLCLDQAEVVTVRDVRAQRILEKLGVTRDIRVMADAAMLLDEEPLADDALANEGLGADKNIIGFSVREPGPAAPDIDIEHYHIQLASAADYLVERFGARIAFVPMEPEMHDVQQSHAVISRMNRAQYASVLRSDYTSGQVLSMIGRFSFVVGMRLHFLIFAALKRVPFVALPYAPKVTGF
ncbi:MAG TPA: polysaccharide pyruvyl transferase family protein, partial [Coriobacteriia bacterium]|nr:polysaccharide pyruvyl transferase family protein [Coriobacteriia bacterium]